MAKNPNVVGLDAILEELGPFGKFNIVNYAFLLFPIYLAGMFGSVYVFEAPDLQYRCSIQQCTDTNPMWLQHAIPTDANGVLSKCKHYRYIGEFSDGNRGNQSDGNRGKQSDGNSGNQSDVNRGKQSDGNRGSQSDGNSGSQSDVNRGYQSDGQCTKEDFDQATIEECDSILYSDEDSAVKDFNLGCQDWKRTLIGTVHNSGLFLSLPITGIVSDKYGRKVALSIASLMNGIFGFLRSFSTNYVMMLVFEFLEAGLGAGAYSTAFVLAMELVGPKGRVFGNTIVNAVYVCGLMTLAALAWQLQNWRTLLKIIYAPACLVFSYLWILNESVRWLLSKGKTQEATAVLQKAAKMNKVQLSEDLLTPLHEMETKNDQEKETEAQAAKPEASTLVKVLKSSIIRKRVLVCSFLWITCTFVYYGLSINSVSLGGNNKYVNFMLVGFVEIPANFMCLLVLDRFGRKRTLITTYVLSACLCISLSILPKDQTWWSLILYLSGKFSITVAYSSVYIYVSEVFPTSARQSLLAVCSSLGRVGSTLAPLTPLLVKYYNNLPAIVFGSLALVASALVFTLPETINVPLPDTIDEAERLSSAKNNTEDV